MSTRSAAEKLLIEPESTVWVSHPRHLDVIEPLPDGVRVVDRPELAATIVIFGDDAQSLRNAVAAHANRIRDCETLWLAYPKPNGDVDRDGVWLILAEHGWSPIGQVSLGDRWAATRFDPLRP